MPHLRYMASEVRIRIVRAGSPVEGAVVTREVAIQDSSDREAQRGITDREGWVLLPDVTRVGAVMSIGEWSVSQKWVVKVGVDEFVIWHGWKAGASRFSERDYGMPTGLLQEGPGLVVVYDIDKAKKPNKAPEPTP